MRSKYALDPNYYKEEYQYPMKIDNEITQVELASILLFNDGYCIEKDNVQCSAGVVLENGFDVTEAGNDYYKTVTIAPLLSYVHCTIHM